MKKFFLVDLFSAVVLILFFILPGKNILASDLDRSWIHIENVPSGLQEKTLLSKVLRWRPSGAPINVTPRNCTSDFLKTQMEKAQGNSDLVFQTLQDYFKRCDKILTRFAPGPKEALIELAGANYNFAENPLLKDVTLYLQDGTIRRGILALKNSATPRPLVVAILGVCENRYDIGARILLMNLFDSSPFNVLILSNFTGSDFIQDNKRFSLGGLEDGKEISEIISLLAGADSPFKNLISSFHVVGESLGGHSALYSSFYDNEIGPHVQSIQAYCPVVNLKESAATFFVNNPNLNLICGESVQLAQKILGLEPTNNQLSNSDILQKITFPETLFGPFKGKKVSKLEDFWKFNRFEDFIEYSKIPTLLWASDDDPVVSPSTNALSLKTQAEKRGSKNLSVIEVSKGSHCAFDVAYGLDVASTVGSEFILSQSPEFDTQRQRQSLTFDELKISKDEFLLTTGEKFFGYEWAVPENKKYALLTIKIWSPETKIDGFSCDVSGPYSAASECFRSVVLRVPFSDLHFPFDYPVSTDTQKLAYARWLNAQVRVLNRSEKTIVNTMEKPDHLEWY